MDVKSYVPPNPISEFGDDHDNRGILTPDFFGKKIFSGTQVSLFSAKSLKLLPHADARF